MRKLFVSVVLVALTVQAFCQGCRFTREDLDFALDSVFFTVQGDYTFFNPSGDTIKMPIKYPVPATGIGKPVDTLMIMDQVLPVSYLPYRMIDTIAIFLLRVPPKSEKTIKIYYSQRHPPGYARYILTTTSKWGRPLEQATYSLFVSEGLRVSYFSYPPDQTRVTDLGIIYKWERSDFLPDHDFEIRYE